MLNFGGCIYQENITWKSSLKPTLRGWSPWMIHGFYDSTDPTNGQSLVDDWTSWVNHSISSAPGRPFLALCILGMFSGSKYLLKRYLEHIRDYFKVSCHSVRFPHLCQANFHFGQKILVVGFNPFPFEKYQSNWIISPNRGEHKEYLKLPPRISIFAWRSCSGSSSACWEGHY